MKRMIFTSAGLLMVSVAAFGQNTTESGNAVFQFAAAGGERNLMLSVDSIGGKVVTGRPYSAVEERHSVQTLGDGTRIESSETNHVYRDEQGRTRIERKDGNITINDPVSGFSAELDPKTRTVSKTTVIRTLARTASTVPDALKSKLAQLQAEAVQVQGQSTTSSPQVTKLKAEILDAQKAVESTQPQMFQYRTINGDGSSLSDEKGLAEYQFTTARTVSVTGSSGPVTLRVAPGNNASVESLPSQMVNGILAEGTRTTETIPVGKIGNDRAISIVNERWYSNNLQMLVKSSSSDPRFGDTTYQLTNIVQSSPDPSLFTIPGDYTMRK